jgi:heavy metal sensor kinase
MARLPIRVRLTLPFAVAMMLVLAALGTFVYVRVGATLLASVDDGLHGQMRESASRLRDHESLLDGTATGGPSIAQVAAAGRVVQSSPTGLPPLLDAADARRAARRTMLLTATVPGLVGSWRLSAGPAGDGRVLVVGSPLGGRGETLERLRHEFLFAAPAALLLATLAGYGLAGAALRPVEAMRRRAAAISAATPDARLPVPEANDEISRLAETLNDMIARLEAAFRHERRFVADASHELRTPLSLLRTELELALARPRSHEELEQALRSAAEETDRLSSLAENLLFVARADQGELPIHAESVHAGELLDRVAGRFTARADELGRTLRVDGGDVVVEGDRMRLEQALGNLVANGLVHGAGTIELSARASDGHVELHVSDEGRGFPADFAPRAFDRFSRADEARGRGGTGLGLAIVQAIAEAHGGTAGLVNRERGGADVWMSLRAAPESVGSGKASIRI